MPYSDIYTDTYVGDPPVFEELDDTYVNQDFHHVLGNSLVLPFCVIDPYDQLMNLSTGYTALMVLNDAAGNNILTFTENSSQGRAIQLGLSDQWSFRIYSLPVGMTALAPYVWQGLVFNLQITEVATGLVKISLRDCTLNVYPQNN